MAIQAEIPPELTDEDKAFLFHLLDTVLNSQILGLLLHGIYTGILAVTLWNIFVNKFWPIRRALVVILILLYALITIDYAVAWSDLSSTFVKNGQSFWTVYSKNLAVNEITMTVEMGIVSSMSTILADSYIIWCCWMVWGRRWLIVLLPILSLLSATVVKIIEIYKYSRGSSVVLTIPYVSFVLATTLWCTVFIILRILTVTGIRRGAGSRLGVYHRFIAVLVESSALYSITLILFLALIIRNDAGLYYFDMIGSIAKGVAPTLIIGRAAAGHTRPTEEDDDSSSVSTLQFQTPSTSTSSIQESTMQSAVFETDIEAQREQSDELVVVVERMQRELMTSV
ncbi:hypothetical protein F5146DRAFT_1144648 [Armillaria mellea]|nr:hypothetical protein F5146DRAFT_1144648 [Armillaria mellea]